MDQNQSQSDLNVDMDYESTQIQIHLQKVIMLDKQLTDESLYLSLHYQNQQFLSKIRKRGRQFKLDESHNIMLQPQCFQLQLQLWKYNVFILEQDDYRSNLIASASLSIHPNDFQQSCSISKVFNLLDPQNQTKLQLLADITLNYDNMCIFSPNSISKRSNHLANPTINNNNSTVPNIITNNNVTANDSRTLLRQQSLSQLNAAQNANSQRRFSIGVLASPVHINSVHQQPYNIVHEQYTTPKTFYNSTPAQLGLQNNMATNTLQLRNSNSILSNNSLQRNSIQNNTVLRNSIQTNNYVVQNSMGQSRNSSINNGQQNIVIPQQQQIYHTPIQTNIQLQPSAMKTSILQYGVPAVRQQQQTRYSLQSGNVQQIHQMVSQFTPVNQINNLTIQSNKSLGQINNIGQIRNSIQNRTQRVSLTAVQPIQYRTANYQSIGQQVQSRFSQSGHQYIQY